MTAAPEGPNPSDGAAGTSDGHSEASGDGGQQRADGAPFRILIVEDDRAQALFAQSVLHGASMQAEVEMTPDGVVAAIERFNPDLVLMDLHMPGQNGMALTMHIRQRPQFVHLPIVFLTGDPDPERQFEVLESGADDFLTKPIRPRHLIAAVSNRIKRARQHTPQRLPSANRMINPETGLPTRAYLMQQLGQALDAGKSGGLFFIEISGAPGLRERYGYASFEQLMAEAGRHLGKTAAPHTLARLNDNSFLAMALGLERDELVKFAHDLRDRLGKTPFTVREEDTLHLRSSVGYATLPDTFADTGSALEATGRAVLQARQQADGVATYQADPEPEDGMHLSLNDEALELAYQPIVSVAGSHLAQ